MLKGGGGDPILKEGKWTFATNYRYENIKFSAAFSAKNSWVVKGKEAEKLLKHEQLHLRIAEYTAAKANSNMPVFKSTDNTAVDADKEKAKAMAKKAAQDEVNKMLADYKATWTTISNKVQVDYDAQTDHGTKPVDQADWEAKYKQFVDSVAKDNGWTK